MDRTIYLYTEIDQATNMIKLVVSNKITQGWLIQYLYSEFNQCRLILYETIKKSQSNWRWEQQSY